MLPVVSTMARTTINYWYTEDWIMTTRQCMGDMWILDVDTVKWTEVSLVLL